MTQSYYDYTLDEYKDNLDSNVLNMIKKSHWLANKSERLGDRYVSYGMMCSFNGGINGCSLYLAGSDGVDYFCELFRDFEEGTSKSLRPVVELKANIFATKVEDTWSLNK